MIRKLFLLFGLIFNFVPGFVLAEALQQGKAEVEIILPGQLSSDNKVFCQPTQTQQIECYICKEKSYGLVPARLVLMVRHPGHNSFVKRQSASTFSSYGDAYDKLLATANSLQCQVQTKAPNCSEF